MKKNDSIEIIDILQDVIQNNKESIDTWFSEKFQKTKPLFYSSVDIRHSGYKLAPVDTNLFPGGFNNLQKNEQKNASLAAKNLISQSYPNIKNILIIAEDHTRNLYYFENIIVLKRILLHAGLNVVITSFQTIEMGEKQEFTSLSGEALTLEPVSLNGKQLISHNGFIPDLVIVNNDLTEGPPSILKQTNVPITPPLGFGWYQRRKTSHFDTYNDLARDLAKQINIDPWLITTIFEHCGVINFKEKKGIECIALNVEKALHNIKKKYEEYNIKQEPFVFIKSNRGTYGMGIMTARSGEDVLDINKNNRKKMNAIKGGTTNTEVIIQEGIPTIDYVNENPAEPMIYSIGNQPIGCFYRANTKRGATENLNSSGMQFHPIHHHNQDSHPCEVLGLIAKLASHAASWECYVESYAI